LAPVELFRQFRAGEFGERFDGDSEGREGLFPGRINRDFGPGVVEESLVVDQGAIEFADLFTGLILGGAGREGCGQGNDQNDKSGSIRDH